LEKIQCPKLPLRVNNNYICHKRRFWVSVSLRTADGTICWEFPFATVVGFAWTERRGEERRAKGLLRPMTASGAANTFPARLPSFPFQSCPFPLCCVPSPLVVTAWEVPRDCLSRDREHECCAKGHWGELWVSREKVGGHEDEEQDPPVPPELERKCRERQTVQRVRNPFSHPQSFRNATASRACSPVSFFRLCLL